MKGDHIVLFFYCYPLLVIFMSSGTYLFWFHYLSSSIRPVNDPGKRDLDTAVCQPISNVFGTKLWFWFDLLSLQWSASLKTIFRIQFLNIVSTALYILLNLQIISGLLRHTFSLFILCWPQNNWHFQSFSYQGNRHKVDSYLPRLVPKVTIHYLLSHH